jgi:hypothetical protein
LHPHILRLTPSLPQNGPPGVYLATGGLDKQVVVWLAEKGVAVAKTTLEEVRGPGWAGGGA